MKLCYIKILSNVREVVIVSPYLPSTDLIRINYSSIKWMQQYFSPSRRMKKDVKFLRFQSFPANPEDFVKCRGEERGGRRLSKISIVGSFADYIYGENLLEQDFGRRKSRARAFWRNQVVDLGDSSLDYEACGNCPGVVALGHAPRGCRSEATTALYALPRIRSSVRSLSVSTSINVIFGNRRFVMEDCLHNDCSRAIKPRTVCDNNFRSIGNWQRLRRL